MASLKNHPGFWMRDDAAASLARWEVDHGIIGVNSAGRHEWEQQNLINRWLQGGTYNRPPYLFEPKRPARASAHVANGGVAFDTSEFARFRRTCADYGWWQPYSWDFVHFEYDPRRDKRRNQPSGGGGSHLNPTPAPKPVIEDDEEENTMKVFGYIKPGDSRTTYVTWDQGGGLWDEFVTNDEDYARSVAKNWGGGAPLLSIGHRDNLAEKFVMRWPELAEMTDNGV